MSPRRENYIVVALGGVTNGGKTSVCKEIEKHLDAVSFHMDHYFWDEDSPNHIRLPGFNGHANWDTVEAVDFDKLYHDVKTWIEKHSKQSEHSSSSADASPVVRQTPVLLVEGILVLNHKPLMELFDQKFYFTLTEEECIKRRNLRNYEPPDPEGYFDGVVWPMHLKFKREIENRNDVVFISGAQDKNKTIELILKQITSNLQ